MPSDPIVHNVYQKDAGGWIEMITGCMFSGKTEELIRRLNRAIIAGLKVEIFKPKIDTRYSAENVVTHNATQIASTSVEFADDILMLADHCDVVGIDEAQFFDQNIVSVANTLANKNKRVIISGLDMDFQGKPFQQVANLLATADHVSKFQAICMKCGGLANYSYRTINAFERVVIGEKEAYEPRCRKCFFEGKSI